MWSVCGKAGALMVPAVISTLNLSYGSNVVHFVTTKIRILISGVIILYLLCDYSHSLQIFMTAGGALADVV